MALIGIEERQPPQRVRRVVRRPDDLCGRVVVIREQRRKLGAERHPRGARQGREIDHEIRFLLAGEGDGVGKHQPAFGIGVADFDRNVGAGVDDVERPHRFRRNCVLCRRHQNPQSDRHAGSHQRRRQAKNGGRPAHVLFHDFHRLRRLQIQPARIEADALADQGD